MTQPIRVNLVQGGTIQPQKVQSSQGDRSIHVSGTFGGASIALMGSNEANGTNGVALRDLNGNVIAITSAAIVVVLELTEYLWPAITGGDGTTNLNISICTG